MTSPSAPATADEEPAINNLTEQVREIYSNRLHRQRTEACLSAPLAPNLPEPAFCGRFHPPPATALPTPVNAHSMGQKALKRQKASPIGTGKDVAGANQRQLHDSACVLTPLSFLPKTGKPAPPSFSPVHHREQLVDLHNTSIDNGHATQRCEAGSGLGPATKAKKVQQIPAQSFQVDLSGLLGNFIPPTPRGDCNTEVGQQPQELLDLQLFKWPPQGLAQESAEYQEAIKPTEREMSVGFDLDFVEALVDSTAEYWKPFNCQVLAEQENISGLKQSAFQKLAEKQDIEKEIIRVQIGLKHRRGRGMNVTGGLGLLRKLETEQAVLDEEIVAIHAEWKSQVVNLSRLTEQAFWPEYHRMDFEAAMQAKKRKLDAQKAEHARLMAMMGCKPIPLFQEKTSLSFRPAPTPTPISTPPSSPTPASTPSRACRPLREAVRVPDWFLIVQADGIMQFSSASVADRYNELLCYIADLQGRMDEVVKTNTTPPLVPPELEKKWHEKNPLWPYPNWRTRGGWWVCRTGPTASAAEMACTRCIFKRDTSLKVAPKLGSEVYREIMDKVQRAMGPSMKKDMMEAKARMATLRCETTE